MKQFDIRKNLSSQTFSFMAKKISTSVRVNFAPNAGKLTTLEGDVRYEAGAAILTGAEGDIWPVERAKFDASYEAINGTTHGQDGIYQKRPMTVLAMQLTEPTSVKVGYANDPITGKAGDWLLQYGEGDFGIVSQAIFEKTYEIISNRN